MKGETTMEESLKMLVEYVLERCTGLEGENRRLEKIATSAQETKEDLYNEVTKQAEKFAKMVKLLKKGIVWNSYPSLYLSGSNFEELCDLLRIEKDGKATI